jgi:hypothetical protein
MDREARVLDDREAAKSYARRLDQAAADLNPFLTAIAVGLLVLYVMLRIGVTTYPAPPERAASPQLTTSKTAYPAPPDYVR